MKIGLYEDWMEPQVIKLFQHEYGWSKEKSAGIMERFYDHPFQRNHCIRIVATEGQFVAGFQSFFRWPYQFNGRSYNSYQSGNSLVHPEHRGKGVFRELLNYLDHHRDKLEVDFLVGFPIDVSVGSLLRNQWLRLFDLSWFIRPVNFFAFLFPLDTIALSRRFPFRTASDSSQNQWIRISHSEEFNRWRTQLYDEKSYYSFHHREPQGNVTFQMKLNIRKKIIREMIIGDIIATSYEPGIIGRALKALRKEIFRTRSITILSFAVNEQAEGDLAGCFRKNGFRKIRKKIFFCIKPFSDDECLKDPSRWMVMRGDIDTW